MRRLVLLLVLCPVAGQAKPKPPDATADPAPPTVDVAAQKKLFRVFSDGKGHYVVMADDRKSLRPSSLFTFFGDGKVLYRQRVATGGRTPEYINLGVPDPRYSWKDGTTGFHVTGHKLTYDCGPRKLDMKELGAAEAGRVVGAAEFRDVYWRRVPHVLTRDDSGTYYYVDKVVQEVSGQALGRFSRDTAQRVFVGPRQRMKPLAMKNIVNDLAGDIYVTAGGKLRLKVDRSKNPASPSAATWFQGRKNVVLTLVDLGHPDTVPMIYNELGVYSGINLHLPCDVF